MANPVITLSTGRWHSTSTIVRELVLNAACLRNRAMVFSNARTSIGIKILIIIPSIFSPVY
jgi:hypothetical protein